MKKHILLLVLVTFLGLTACAPKVQTISFSEEQTKETTPNEKVEKESDIYVSVGGCVNKPGVYIVPESSRVFEVINIAGGVTRGADTDALNLVNVVKDGMKIVVPSKKASANEGDKAVTSEENKSSLVNINEADVETLTSLPGIGKSKATAIVSYREKNGYFGSIEDIKNVSGIKDGTFEAIKDCITTY